MENLEMQEAFLGYLYGKNYGAKDPCLDTVDKWVKSSKLNRTAFWQEYEKMIKGELIKFVQDDAVIRLTPKGTLLTEKSGLVPGDMIASNREVRKKLMFAMATWLTSHGPLATVADLARVAKIGTEEVSGNLQLLVSMGYAKWEVPGERLSISPRVCAKTGSVGKAA